ncbi:iron chelate uptake ABC transporter family permease subunit, partial [Bacillus sp. SIMBA_161]
NEFQIVQDRMFASFNNVNADLVWISLLFVIVLLGLAWGHNASLDVLSLGRDTAVNLGVGYDSLVKKMLVLSAVLIAIATALVGPITFFG